MDDRPAGSAVLSDSRSGPSLRVSHAVCRSTNRAGVAQLAERQPSKPLGLCAVLPRVVLSAQRAKLCAVIGPADATRRCQPRSSSASPRGCRPLSWHGSHLLSRGTGSSGQRDDRVPQRAAVGSGETGARHAVERTRPRGPGSSLPARSAADTPGSWRATGSCRCRRSGVRSSGRISRWKPGSELASPGVSAQPGMHRVDGDPRRASGGVPTHGSSATWMRFARA